MSDNLSEIASLFGYCNKSVEELVQPVTNVIETESIENSTEYYQIPDHATMDLGYSQTWHDLIDIRVPMGKVPLALLMPRVPLPLHHQNPRNILTKIDKGWWERTRRRVYDVQGQHCAVCGRHKLYQPSKRKVLEAHELYDIDYTTGTVKLLGIIPICPVCHKFIHFGLVTAWLESGTIDVAMYNAILEHGNRVLEENNLPKKNMDATVNDNRYNIAFDKWHLDLCINGQWQSFYSLYKNEADLEAHY